MNLSSVGKTPHVMSTCVALFFFLFINLICFFQFLFLPPRTGAVQDGKANFATNACPIRAASTATATDLPGSASARRIGVESSATKVRKTKLRYHTEKRNRIKNLLG
jgi:hypothetical protein